MANSNAEEWTTVADETPAQVIFDTVGDVFVGRFVEKRTLTPNPEQSWDQFVFRGIEDGELYGINSSYSIAKGMETVQPGSVVRLTYVKDVEVGRPSPMKDFKIEVKK